MNLSRARTLAHMQTLLAAGAAVTACTPAKTPGSDADGGTTDVKPPMMDPGYAVVDPLPNPAYTPDLQALIKPTIKLTKPDKIYHFVVTIPRPTGRDDFKFVSDAEPVVYGGKATKSKPGKDAWVVEGTVDDSTNVMRELAVSVRGTYSKGPTTISVSASWSVLDPNTPPELTVGQF